MLCFLEDCLRSKQMLAPVVIEKSYIRINIHSLMYFPGLSREWRCSSLYRPIIYFRFHFTYKFMAAFFLYIPISPPNPGSREKVLFLY